MNGRISYLDSVKREVIENSKTHYPIISSDVIEPAAWELAAALDGAK